MLLLLLILAQCYNGICTAATPPNFGPVVVYPRVTVDRTTDPIQVYGFLKDGRRVGYYLPTDASAEQVIDTTRALNDYLNLADLGLWEPAPRTVTPEEARATKARPRPRADP